MIDCISDSALLREVDRFVCDNKESVVRDIGRLVAIPSLDGKPEPGAPYGAEPRRALTCALGIAEELGLKTVVCDDHLGYAFIGEDRPEGYLATITHVDVVSPGDGWPADPFTLRLQDGYLIGRGVLDDKGPSVLCLYALKFLQDSGRKLRYPIRALLGCSEETGMDDAGWYLSHYPAPLFCISPDANFPLINGEKGIYHARLISRHRPDRVLGISGGVAANAVAATASALVRAASLSGSNTVSVREAEPGLWELSASGVSGHASTPEGTVSAIALLIDYLLENDIPGPDELPYFRFLQKLHQSTDGSGLGLQSSDGRFTPLTAIGGKISTEDGIITQTIDCRYGTSMSGEKITALLRSAAGSAADIRVDSDEVPFFIEPDDAAIAACMDCYRAVTGENNAEPITIGGGTYARHFPRACAFGPDHHDRPMPDFCGPIHGVNEAASLSDFLEALKIYILALISLEELYY